MVAVTLSFYPRPFHYLIQHPLISSNGHNQALPGAILWDLYRTCTGKDTQTRVNYQRKGIAFLRKSIVSRQWN